MDLEYIILNPNRDPGSLKNTVGSIHYHSISQSYLSVVGDDATDEDVAEMQKICQTYKADTTIASLVNLGMSKIKAPWGFILFAGSRIPSHLEEKLDTFTKKDSDILFPVVDRKTNFVDGCFNGVLLNKKIFKKVGKFPAVTMDKAGMNDFEVIKMLWAMEAIAHGCTFKAIVGMRII